jgi:hypothetical protein
MPKKIIHKDELKPYRFVHAGRFEALVKPKIKKPGKLPKGKKP